MSIKKENPKTMYIVNISSNWDYGYLNFEEHMWIDKLTEKLEKEWNFWEYSYSNYEKKDEDEDFDGYEEYDDYMDYFVKVVKEMEYNKDFIDWFNLATEYNEDYDSSKHEQHLIIAI